MQKAEKRLNSILKKLKNSNISNEKIQSLEIAKRLCNVDKSPIRVNFLFNLSFLLTLLFGLLILSSYVYTNEVSLFELISHARTIIENPYALKPEIFHLFQLAFSVCWKPR